jgi:hypothetical protein
MNYAADRPAAEPQRVRVRSRESCASHGLAATTGDDFDGRNLCDAWCLYELKVERDRARANVWIRSLMIGDEATVRRKDGVLLINNVGGIEGLITHALNWGSEGSVTWASDYVTSTVSLERMQSSGNLDHEFGHVAQSRELGILYTQAYIGGALITLPIWMASGFGLSGISIHDAHPMERDAEIRANHGDPWFRGR